MRETEAFMTNLKDTVALRLPERTIVITPDRPQQFVYDIWKIQGAFRS